MPWQIFHQESIKKNNNLKLLFYKSEKRLEYHKRPIPCAIIDPIYPPVHSTTTSIPRGITTPAATRKQTPILEQLGDELSIRICYLQHNSNNASKPMILRSSSDVQALGRVVCVCQLLGTVWQAERKANSAGGSREFTLSCKTKEWSWGSGGPELLASLPIHLGERRPVVSREAESAGDQSVRLQSGGYPGLKTPIIDIYAYLRLTTIS
ncbi:hypothetical protein EDB86DRAFT_3241373 [Lactarius hatsudake]|nr:hypothetical protein EDB86DRAFT_3241373 [Lactarius hatsudake]